MKTLYFSLPGRILKREVSLEGDCVEGKRVIYFPPAKILSATEDILNRWGIDDLGARIALGRAVLRGNPQKANADTVANEGETLFRMSLGSPYYENSMVNMLITTEEVWALGRVTEMGQSITIKVEELMGLLEEVQRNEPLDLKEYQDY